MIKRPEPLPAARKAKTVYREGDPRKDHGMRGKK